MSILTTLFWLIHLAIAINDETLVLTSILKNQQGKSIQTTEYYSHKLRFGFIKRSEPDHELEAFARATSADNDSKLRVVEVKYLQNGTRSASIAIGSYPDKFKIGWLKESIDLYNKRNERLYVIGISWLTYLVRAYAANSSSIITGDNKQKSLKIGDKMLKIEYESSKPKIQEDFPVSIEVYQGETKIFDVRFNIWKDYPSLESFIGSTSFSKKLDIFTYPIGLSIHEIIDRYEMRLPQTESSLERLSFKARTELGGQESTQTVYVDFGGEIIRINDRDSLRDLSLVIDRKYNLQYIVRNKLHKIEDWNPSLEDYVCQIIDMEQVNKTDIMHLLFGTHLFAYMGDAMVRGVRARVFEGRIDNLPIWMDLWSATNHTKSGKAFLRGKSDRKKEQDQSGSVVLYVRHEGELDVDLTLSKILRVEILGGPQYVSELFEFAHELEGTEEGEGVGDIFALPRCYTQFYKKGDSMDVELVLDKTMTSVVPAWWKKPYIRDAILLKELNSTLRLPISSIFALETKVEDARLIVKFKVGRKEVKMNKLTYLKSGRLRMHVNFNNWAAETPAECLINFHHFSEGTRFLYFSPEDKLCGLDNQIKEDTDIGNENSAFVFDEEGSGEIYKVNNSMVKTISDNQGRLRSQLSNLHTLNLGAGITTNVIERRIAIDGSSSTEDVAFVGLKLREDIKSVNGSHVSHDKCETACMEDLDCMSFAYCEFLDSPPTCSLSSIVLEGKKKSIREQVEDSGILKGKTGTELKLRLIDGDFKFLRDQRCTLYRKAFIEMFSCKEMAQRSIEYYEVLRVKSIDECAIRCFRITQTGLKRLVEHDEKIQEAAKNILSDPNEDAKTKFEEIKKIRTEHSRVIYKEMCRNFHYMDDTISVSNTDLLDKGLREVDDEDKEAQLERRFCIVNERESQREKRKPTGPSGIHFEEYRFNHASLFIKNRSVAMGSSLKVKEKEIFQKILSNQILDPKEVEILNLTLKAGKNNQMEKSLDVDECARQCIENHFANVPWPSCKSIDTYKTTDGQQRCRLNTQVAGSIDTVDLSRVSYPGQREPVSNEYHYELKPFGALKLEANLISDIEVEIEKERELTWSEYLSSNHSHGGIIFLLIVLGLATGVWTGMKIVVPAARYLNLNNGEASDLSHKTLVPNLDLDNI